MKKICISLLLISITMLLGTTKAVALGCTINSGIKGGRGDYAYDINSVEVKGKNLVIKGWGLLNSNGGDSKIHNIQPTYKLKLEGYNATGTDPDDTDVNLTFKSSTEYDNYLKEDRGYKEYSSSSATPNDYTEFFYTSTSCSSPYRFYKGGDRASSANGKALCAPAGTFPKDKNYLYININFEFRIPLKDITTLANKDVNRVYLRLSISTDGATKTVYGNAVNTMARSETCIPVTLQSSRVGDITLSTTDYTIRSVEDDTDIITMMVVNGHPRPTRDYMNYWYYKYYDSSLKKTILKKCSPGSTTCGSEVFYYQGTTSSKSDKGNYQIVGNPEEYYGYLSSITEPIYLYKTRIALENTKYGFTDYVISSSFGSIAYVPALWVKPYLQDIGTYFEVENPTCQNNEKCTNLGSGSTCPTDCCDTYCQPGGGNEKTPYCINVCKSGDGGGGDGGGDEACDKISDPQEKYCCLSDYKNQEVCSIYKKKDSSYTKTNLCSQSTEVTSNYKYPKEGYGDEQFTNEACKISCSETIRVTFPKAISEVRAGMGFTYPIKIDSDRYCTAEYLNDSWKQAVEDAITNAKNAYNTMKTSIDKAYSDDAVCGDKLVVNAGNVCSAGESLTSDGRCKKNIGFDACSGSSTSGETSKSSTTCSASGPTCNCKTTTSTRTKTCAKTNKKTGACTSYKYSSWSSSSSTSSFSICRGTYEGGSCYSYRGACPARSSWNSSTGRCEKIMCTNNSSTYFSDAQSIISPSISTANSAKSTYQSALARYNKLVNDRNTCDNYVTQTKYSGASKTNIKIDTDEDISQTAYALTNSASTEASISAANKGKPYQVTTCISKENFVAKDSKYNDGVYPGGGENLSVEKCNFDVRNYTFYDYWNKKTSAINEYEFKTSYSVMDYTGEILETSTVPKDTGAYVSHGRYAYIGFYDLTGKYKFTNRLTNIGANISNKDKSIFKLNFDCSYNVNNLIFPQEDDANFNLYGSVGFGYRPVSLLDVFPNRNPRENWSTTNAVDLTRRIESSGYSIYSNTPKYLITLTGNTMSKIREYNNSYGYDNINVKTPYTSNFITEYLNNGVIISSEKR